MYSINRAKVSGQSIPAAMIESAPMELAAHCLPGFIDQATN
jgi:hypothetical protein